MKLPQQRQTGVQSLGRRSPGQPLANANRRAGQTVDQGRAEVRLAQERGAIAMQAGRDITQFAMKLAESETKQGYFEQVMNFETKAKKSMQQLTKSNMLDLNSIEIPESAEGILDKYAEKDVDGRMVRMAPAHEVGDAIHEARLREYIEIGDAQLGSDKTKDEYRRAIRATYANSSEAVFAKGTIDRVNMLKAKTDLNFDNAIDMLDVETAGQIAATALATGAWSNKEYGDNMEQLGSRIDAKYFTKEILTAETSDELLDIFDELNTQSNNLTAAQQMNLSLRAESRRDKMENDELVAVELDKGAIKSNVLRGIDSGEVGIHNLYQMGLPPEIIPAMRTAIIQRDRVGEQFSYAPAVEHLQTVVEGVQFPTVGKDTAQMAMDAKGKLYDSMLSGAISYPKYQQMKSDVEQNVKSNYSTPEYKSAEDSIQMEVLGMSEAEATAFARSARWNKDKSAEKKIIELGKMKAKAQQDLQAHMRANGVRAKPMEWWDKNKQLYTQDAMSERASKQFDNQYPGEAVKRPDGSVDVEETKRKMVKLVTDGGISEHAYDQRYKALMIDDTIQNVEPVQ